jgi:hypothetical protein
MHSRKERGETKTKLPSASADLHSFLPCFALSFFVICCYCPFALHFVSPLF